MKPAHAAILSHWLAHMRENGCDGIPLWVGAVNGNTGAWGQGEEILVQACLAELGGICWVFFKQAGDMEVVREARVSGQEHPAAEQGPGQAGHPPPVVLGLLVGRGGGERKEGVPTAPWLTFAQAKFKMAREGVHGGDLDLRCASGDIGDLGWARRAKEGIASAATAEVVAHGGFLCLSAGPNASRGTGHDAIAATSVEEAVPAVDNPKWCHQPRQATRQEGRHARRCKRLLTQAG